MLKNKVSYKLYNDILKDKYNIKILVLNKLGLNHNFKINCIDDISILIEKFSKLFVYSNIEYMNGNHRYDAEYIIESLLFDSKGGVCYHLNILFGLFLYQYGIKVKLIRPFDKSDYNILSQFRYHAFNLIQFKDPSESKVKKYIVDVCLGYFSSFSPVEIGCEKAVFTNKNKCYFRAIKHDDGQSYIYQFKKADDQDYTPVFQFSTKTVLHDDIKKNYNNYGVFATSIVVYKVYDDGIHIMNENSFKIDYFTGQFHEISLKGNDQINHYLINYFNLNSKLPTPKL